MSGQPQVLRCLCRQQQLVDRLLQDPAVESLSSSVGIDGTNTTLNGGRLSINLKPLDERDDMDSVLARLRREQRHEGDEA